MPPVRTRFAPSPTGYLHMGSARTALFNWAFARRQQGCFVLRIEDTDRERSTQESERALLDGLRWLGIDWDEGPFRQSERLERYAEAVERLLGQGRAYRCVCSAESLQQRREATLAAGQSWVYDGRCRELDLGPNCGPHTVRLRIDPAARLGWSDLVFGDCGQQAGELGDMNIRRSDGHPLYNLAVVVDDIEMAISHVIRGADHLGNTSFQLALYRALDATPPLFAHVPLIVGPGGKKLSKRRDPVSVQQYRDEGFLPEALCNWLARIGWSDGDTEIFSREEIAERFDLAAVHRASAQADRNKLSWLNQHYLQNLPTARLQEAAAPFFEAVAGHPLAAETPLERIIDLLRERSTTLVDMAERARFLLVDVIGYEEKAASKHLGPDALPLLVDLHTRLQALTDWREAELEVAFEALRESHSGIGMGKIAQPVRVAVTGSAASPGIYETLAVLGRQRTLARLAEAIHFVRHG